MFSYKYVKSITQIPISGCVGSPSCDHTSQPRVPLQFDISTHIAKTGHVAVSPLPFPHDRHSLQLGADIKKQWKDLVLAGRELYSHYLCYHVFCSGS